MSTIENKSPPRVPLVLAGQWIAWDHGRSKIVANGTTLQEALTAARLAGEPHPYLTKAPDPNVRFVGGLR